MINAVNQVMNELKENLRSNNGKIFNTFKIWIAYQVFTLEENPLFND